MSTPVTSGPSAGEEGPAFRDGFAAEPVLSAGDSVLDRAKAIAEARAAGRTLADVARELGMSVKRVRRYGLVASYPAELQGLVEGRRLPMAHARVLAQAGVDDPEEWVQRCARHGWSAQQLERELRRLAGKKSPGRKRTYLRREKDAIRFYAFRIGRGSPAAERVRVIALLESAIEFLRG